MSQAIVTESKLVAIADAIRSVGSLSGSMTLDQMASAILSLSGGGGGGSSNEDGIIERSLSEITNNTVAYVGSYAFYSYNTLKSVSFGNASYVGMMAFQQCYSIVSANFPRCELVDYAAFNYCSKLSDASFPECSIVSTFAFAYCSKLDNFSLAFPKLSYALGGAFSHCSCVSINLPSLIRLGGGSVFAQNSSLTTLDFPELLYPNGTRNFASNYKLQNVNMPKITFLDTSAFYDCVSLKALSFPALESIYNFAFWGCTSLSSFDAPNLTSVGQSAFYFDYYLRRFSIPKATYIGAGAFLSCSRMSLLDLTSVSAVPNLANINAFQNTPISNSAYLGNFGSIYVPASLYNAFITSTNWVTYAARITSDPVPA